MDHIAVDGEGTIAAVMNGFRILLRRIDPGFDDFENAKAVLGDKVRVGHLAFEIGEVLADQRRFYRALGTGVSPNAANLSASLP
jgi:hypothetical protein